LLVLSRQVSLAPLIAPSEAIPVRVALLPWKMRMLVLIPVGRVPPAVILKVLLRPDNSIAESLSLNVL
jgi:hypothetical protein